MNKVLTDEELEAAIDTVRKVVKKSGTTINFDVATDRGMTNPESNSVLIRGSFVKSDGQELAGITMIDGAYENELLTTVVEDIIEGYEADRKRKEEI